MLDVARASGLFPAEQLDEVAASLDNLSKLGDAGQWVIDAGNPAAAVIAYSAPEPMTNGA